MAELVWSDRFDADVLSDLNQLVQHPWSGSRIKNSNARHLLVVGRQYTAIHTVENRGIILHALFDQRRDPEMLARLVREITGGLVRPPS